ncbi:MAG: hypothetical protein KDA79_02685 [Planctomycetaceae bacterium]|nr:hypothetical protein [Planctomycetaceae bacterium]
MRRIMLCLFCFALGGAAMYSAFSYHVVRTPDTVVFVPRIDNGLKDTYCDIREWTLGEWRDHPGLIRALMEDGRSDLIVNPGTLNPFGDLLQQFRNAAGPGNSGRR